MRQTVLSEKPQLLYNYFKQLFAQVIRRLMPFVRRFLRIQQRYRSETESD
ncbi:glutamate synthase central domain-containing protein [Phascolarctobacterium succinatutens]